MDTVQTVDYYSIPFSEEVIENPIWPPGNESWLFEEERQKQIKEYNEAEKKVLFEGMRVGWESCDCGDGYGCSHGSWPYEINFDYDKDAQIEFVDEGIEISKNGVGLVHLSELKNISVGQFIDALKTMKIEVKFKKQST